MQVVELKNTIERCMAIPLVEVRSGREVEKNETLRIKLDVAGYLPHSSNEWYSKKKGVDFKKATYGGIFIGTRQDYLEWFWGVIWGKLNWGKIIGTHYYLQSNGLELEQKNTGK